MKLQEAENQIITNYEVYDRRPYDSNLLVAAIETHQALLARTPRFTRCRYKGLVGMNRWVGLGVIADNVVNIGRAMEKEAAS